MTNEERGALYVALVEWRGILLRRHGRHLSWAAIRDMTTRHDHIVFNREWD